MKKKKILILTSIILILTIITGILSFIWYKNQESKPETIFANEEIVNKIVYSNEGEENFDGIIGYLTIESINLLQAPIKEGTEMETLNEYIGHFTDSNFLEGNVALAGHNRGYSKKTEGAEGICNSIGRTKLSTNEESKPLTKEYICRDPWLLFHM